MNRGLVFGCLALLVAVASAQEVSRRRDVAFEDDCVRVYDPTVPRERLAISFPIWRSGAVGG